MCPLFRSKGVIACVAVSVVVILASAANGTEPTRPVWRSELKEALQASQQTGRPMLVFVSSENCAYCKRMAASTLNHPTIQADLARSFVPVAIDPRGHGQVIKRLGVRAFPTTLIISPDANVQDVMQGFITPDVLHGRLARFQAATNRTARRDAE